MIKPHPTKRRTIMFKMEPDEQEFIVTALQDRIDGLEKDLKIPNDPSMDDVHDLTGRITFNQEIIDEINELAKTTPKRYSLLGTDSRDPNTTDLLLSGDGGDAVVQVDPTDLFLNMLQNCFEGLDPRDTTDLKDVINDDDLLVYERIHGVLGEFLKARRG